MENVNNELKKPSNWFQAKLSIYIKNHILLYLKQQQQQKNRQKLDLQFSINDIEIDRVNEVLFLGVILDEHLSWKSQIQNVARKVSKSVGIIYKSSFCLNKTSFSTPYYTVLTRL